MINRLYNKCQMSMMIMTFSRQSYNLIHDRTYIIYQSYKGFYLKWSSMQSNVTVPAYD